METVRMYTSVELAEFLKLSEDHIRRMVSQRTIPFVKIGRSVRFKSDDIDQWLSTKRVYTKNEINRAATTIVAVSQMKGKSREAVRPAGKI